MENDAELVVAFQAATPFEAQNVAGILRSEGIPVFIEGGFLQDEIAVAGRITGRVDCQVRVPKSYLKSARDAIAAARLSGRTFEEAPEEEE